MVVRGVRVSQNTNEEIIKLSKVGQNNQRSNWHSIQDEGSNRTMKYKHTERIKRDRHWKMTTCALFLSDVHDQVIDKVFPPKDHEGNALTPYQLGGFNLLKNEGKIVHDQEAHTDYADRLPK